MKRLVTLIIGTIFTLSCGNSHIKDQCIKIYEEGSEQIRKAGTQQEISDISYQVAEKIVQLSLGENGEEILSASDQAALSRSQQVFFQTVETRARQLHANNTTNEESLILRH